MTEILTSVQQHRSSGGTGTWSLYQAGISLVLHNDVSSMSTFHSLLRLSLFTVLHHAMCNV
jgi:hypothetical protein